METAALRLNSQETGSVNLLKLSEQTAEFSKQFAMLPVKRMEELVTTTSPALHQLDRTALALNIASCIGDYLNFIGCSNSMSEATTMEVANMMIDSYPHLSVDAIKTFFYECKRGTYGFHYNKMDGSKLLMWFDKFVQDYYQRIDDYEYSKHESTKGEHATPMQTLDGEQPIDYDTFFAMTHPREKEMRERDEKIKEIRSAVQKECMPLYSQMSPEEANKILEERIIEEMQKQNLLTF